MLRNKNFIEKIFIQCFFRLYGAILCTPRYLKSKILVVEWKDSGFSNNSPGHTCTPKMSKIYDLRVLWFGWFLLKLPMYDIRLGGFQCFHSWESAQSCDYEPQAQRTKPACEYQTKVDYWEMKWKWKLPESVLGSFSTRVFSGAESRGTSSMTGWPTPPADGNSNASLVTV